MINTRMGLMGFKKNEEDSLRVLQLAASLCGLAALPPIAETVASN